MSRTLSANYTTENDKLGKKPVVRVAFNGITRGYVSGTYVSLSANDKKFLIKAIINLQKFDLLRAPFALIGDTFFEVLDKDDDVTQVIEGDNLVGVAITLSLGFQDIAVADFLDFPVTTINSSEYNEENNPSYKFMSKDARKLIGEKLFETTHTDKLNGAITNTASTATVDDVTGFLDPTNMPAFMHTTDVGYIVIDSEIIQYTGVNAGVQFTGLSRGLFFTNQAAHEDNAVVKQIFVWRNTPAHTALLTILMGTRDASGHAYFDLSNYDGAYGAISDIGLTETEVDIDEIHQRSVASNAYVNFFTDLSVVREVNAITFIEEEILKPMGFFMYVKNNGKLTISSFDRIYIESSFSSAGTLNDDEIARVKLKTREDLMINTVNVLNARDLLSGVRTLRGSLTDFGGLYQLDESVTAYNSTQKPLKIDTTVFGGPGSVPEVIDAYLYKWLYFFGNTPATLKVRVKAKNIALEPGDWVQITRSSLPQLRDGTKGWTNVRGLVMGQKIEAPLSPNPLEYEIFVWDLYDRVDNAITINSTTVTDDTTVTFSADNDADVDTEDGHHDFAGTPTIDWIIFVVSITKPNETPAGSWETISLGFHIQSPKGTDVAAFTARNIPYFTEDSDVITYEFQFAAASLTGDTLATAKVDWYERSTATAGKQVTVAFDTVRYGTFDNTISAV